MASVTLCETEAVFDLRYHVASLAAVFVALILGIFVGVGLSGKGFVSDTSGRASVFTQVRYLILPSICLVLVLFGYIARITRAGVIEALEADYTRTATLKGLPRAK